MLIDLHAHSSRSDGTTTPREVVTEARARGLDVVALTDHDTAQGWSEAAGAAAEVGITFVPGIEVSCGHQGRSAHLLAYLPDPTYPPLVETLRSVLEGRDQRLPRICARLRELGIPLEVADVVAGAGDATALGRPHVADALISRGVVSSREEAFDTYLSPGRPAYVHRSAASLEEAIGTVRDAGGVPVLAHPWGRHDAEGLQEDGLARLQELGLAGVEVDHEDHTPEQRLRLRGIAAELDLVVTGASDFHGAGKRDHELGCNTTAPEQYDRLLARAEDAARASGRRTPQVAGR